MDDFHRLLQVIPIGKYEKPLFNLRSFLLFKNSEHGNVLLFGNPHLLAPLAVFPYLLAIGVHLFRAECFFIKSRGHMLGQFALRERPDSLFIASIAITEVYRRLGIATYILNLAERTAAMLGKHRLELSVLKANTPAQKLYTKYGFTAEQDEKWSLIMTKPVRGC